MTGRETTRVKSLNVHLQPARSPDLDADTAVARLQAVAPATVECGDDDGPYINVNFRTAKLATLWAAVRELLRADPALARCSIVVCQGAHGWDDYKLLHHFDPAVPLDTLRPPGGPGR